MILFGLALLAPLAALAQSADLAAGKAAYAPCAVCHGALAEGNPAMQAPALAGQHEDYLRRQLDHFERGLRGSDPRDIAGQQMREAAALLPDSQERDSLLAYLATLPSPDPAPVGDHNGRNGEVQYNAACGACHGPGGKGNPRMNSPRLAGLDAAYLRRQYRNFAEGIRGSHPDDRLGRQMQMMAGMLATEQDLTDVIGYLLSQ